LLVPRGFSPVTREYQYAINPQFGSVARRAATFQAPARISVELSVDLAPSLPVQQVRRWYDRPGRTGPSIDSLVLRYSRNTANPFTALLRQSDTLLLSTEQSRLLVAFQRAYRTSADSAWRQLATKVISASARLSDGDIVALQDEVAHALVVMGHGVLRREIRPVLSPAQIAIASGLAGELLRAELPPKRREMLLM
jgi:hypothetical protein